MYCGARGIRVKTATVSQWPSWNAPVADRPTNMSSVNYRLFTDSFFTTNNRSNSFKHASLVISNYCPTIISLRLTVPCLLASWWVTELTDSRFDGMIWIFQFFKFLKVLLRGVNLKNSCYASLELEKVNLNRMKVIGLSDTT